MLLDLKDQDDQEKLLVFLLAIALRHERKVWRAIRPSLSTALLNTRGLIEEMFPGGQFRQYQWQQLQPRMFEEMRRVSTELVLAMPEILNEVTPVVRQRILAALGIRYVPTSREPVQSQALVTVVRRALLRAANDIDTKVRSMLLQGELTADIARAVVPTVTSRGALRLSIRKGSTANLVKARIDNMLAETTWSHIADVAMKTFPEADDWQWNARLDVLTCPICSALDGQTGPLSTFDQKPPIHPRCRCLLIPQL